MKKIKDRINFEIELELVRGHKTLGVPYRQNPLQHLIKECDQEARKCRETCMRCLMQVILNAMDYMH